MSSFIAREIEHHLEVIDRRSTTFRSEHKFLIEAQLPSRFFVREYIWTGSGVEKEHLPELISEIDVWGFPHHRIHGPLIVEGNTRIVVVDLGRTIDVGETETVIFRQRMKDLNDTFKPFFSVTPSREVRNSIRLRLVLPDWSGLRVMYRRFTHDTEKVMESAEVKPADYERGKLLFEKEIIKPIARNMGHRLEWTHGEL